jgi:hypothetical protein
LTTVWTPRSLAAALVATALGGCAIEHTLVLDSPSHASPPAAPSAAASAPAPAAPTTAVTSSALPPPPGAVDASQEAPASSPPPPSTAQLSLSAEPPAAGLPGAVDAQAGGASLPAEPPRLAPGAQPAGLGGQWTLSSAGQSCTLTLQEPPSSRTGWVQAGPSCGNFAVAASWTLSGSQLYLYDGSTRTLGRLTAAGPNRFEGTSAQGATISLVR